MGNTQRNTALQQTTQSNSLGTTAKQVESPLVAVELALKQYQDGTVEFRALTNLKLLYAQVEQTIEQGQKAFGKGVFKLFDFVKECLPEQEINQLKYYNRRQFQVFDKYIQLKDITQELSDQMRQLILGLSRDSDLKSLLLKGAEKGFDDCLQKYKQAKSIEQAYDQPDRVADFFELIYEKFEKEIDNFFDQRFGDVGEANSFYKLKTKFLDRKLKGLQQLVVKQNFEIVNTKSFYEKEVTHLQSEIGDIKKDFSQNLADVKSSMIQYGFNEDEVTSMPDVELMQNSDEYGLGNEEEKISTNSRSSFKNTGQSQMFLQSNLISELHSNPISHRQSQRKAKDSEKQTTNKSTMSKNSDAYENNYSGYEPRARRENQTTYEKKPPLRHTYTQQNQNYYGFSQRDSHNQSQDLNSSRHSRNSKGQNQSNHLYYATSQSKNQNDSGQNGYFRRQRKSQNNITQNSAGQSSAHNNSGNSRSGRERLHRQTITPRAQNNIFTNNIVAEEASNSFSRSSNIGESTIQKPVLQVQQALTDEEFSIILGGSLYLKGNQVEVMSNCSQQEEDPSKQDHNDDKRNQNIQKGTNNVFTMGSTTVQTSEGHITDQALNQHHYDINNNINSDRVIGNDDFQMKRVQSSGQINIFKDGLQGESPDQNKPNQNSPGKSGSGKENDASNSNSVKHAKKVSKFSLTFCNPSPAESREVSRERPMFSQMVLQQQKTLKDERIGGQQELL